MEVVWYNNNHYSHSLLYRAYGTIFSRCGACDILSEKLARMDTDEVLDAIRRFLDVMASDYSKRLEFSDRMRSYVDGHGASRIAEALV